MATLQNIGKLKYRSKDGQWHPLPVVVQDASGGVSTISGNGAPTSATQGKVNQLYRNEDTQRLYICTATGGGYTWEAVVSDTEDAVTYTAQTLTEVQKAQARANIGAGTSNFSGSFNDLNDQPNIPAATVIDTTLSKSGQAADAKAAGDAIGKKIDAPQVAQVGEVLTVEEVDADGKPKKWKTSPAAAKQKQADWNQNDETAADYVKNRFGGYTKTVTETKTVVVEAGAQSAPDEFASFPPFTAGDVVNIVVNNVDYSLTAYRPSGAPVDLEIAVVAVTTGNSGWALACGKLGEIDNSYIIYFENSTDSEITIQYNVSREEAVTIEPKYIPNVKPEDIKDMYYTAAEEIDLAGYTLTNVNYKGDHDEVYPFELGQVWNASGNNINYTNLEVKQADDGTLYIGDLNKSNPPFFISTTSGGANSAWISNGNPGTMNLVGVSGKITTEVVHKISDKYIPDSVAYKDELPKMAIMELTVPNAMQIADINVDDTYNSAHVIVKGSEIGKLSLTTLAIHYKNNTYYKYIFNALTKSELKSSDIPYVMFLYIDMSGSGTAWLLNPVVASTEKMDVIIPSSTMDSTKKFKITVNDSGTLSAVEVNT